MNSKAWGQHQRRPDHFLLQGGKEKTMVSRPKIPKCGKEMEFRDTASQLSSALVLA